jgi:hypothetical protein
MFSKRHYAFLASAIMAEPDLGLRIAMCLHLEAAFTKNSLVFNRYTWRTACGVHPSDLTTYLAKGPGLE